MQGESAHFCANLLGPHGLRHFFAFLDCLFLLFELGVPWTNMTALAHLNVSAIIRNHRFLPRFLTEEAVGLISKHLAVLNLTRILSL